MGTKAAIIVLVIIAVLFVGFEVWGSSNNKSQFNSDEPPSFLKWFGGLSAGPKLDVKQLQPATKTFDLARQANYTVHVAADNNNPFRQVEVKIQPANAKDLSCAQVTFTPTPSKDLDPNLEKQQTNDNKELIEKKKTNEFTLTIPKVGGSLVIGRRTPSSTAPCSVNLD